MTLYIDSNEDVLKINGKCYQKVTGDFGYETHTTAVIRDSFSTTCTDCWITVSVGPGESAILRRDTEYLRFTGNSGDSGLIIIDDGNGIYNIEISNDGGSFVFDEHNTNGIRKVFGAPPETYVFTLGGLTHSITLSKLGSFFLDFRFNITNEVITRLFPGDSNRDGVADSVGGDSYSEIGAQKSGFSVNDIHPDFSSSVSNYLQVEFKDIYRFKSSIPHSGSREDAVQDIADLINTTTVGSGLRASFDGNDFKVWYAPNNTIAPVFDIVESIHSSNEGFEQIVKNVNYRDSDGDGIIDSEDCDPLNLNTAGVTPAIYDPSNIQNYPTTINDVVKICFGGGRIPPKRCYTSFASETNSAKEALEDIEKHIQQDYALGLTGYSAQMTKEGLSILDPVTKIAPPQISVESTTSGYTQVVPQGLNVSKNQPSVISINGLTQLGGNASGDYAITNTKTGNNYFAYKNINNYWLWHDGSQFIISDTFNVASNTNSWIGNGSVGDIVQDFDTGNGNWPLPDGPGISTTSTINTAGSFGNFAFTTSNSIPVLQASIFDLKEYEEQASLLSLNLHLKLPNNGNTTQLNYWVYDNEQPCVKKEGSYKLVTVSNENGSLVFDSNNRYGQRFVFTNPTVSMFSLVDPSEKNYNTHGNVAFEFTSGSFLVNTSF